jgi:hypothetical protein
VIIEDDTADLLRIIASEGRVARPDAQILRRAADELDAMYRDYARTIASLGEAKAHLRSIGEQHGTWRMCSGWMRMDIV